MSEDPFPGRLNVMSVLSPTFVNGPTVVGRAIVHFQGCPFACPGCFNPESWAFTARDLWDPVDLAAHVLSLGVDGLTISGGEALSQARSLLPFLRALHVDGDPSRPLLEKGIIMFAGHTLEEIESSISSADMRVCLSYVDLLIDGRYVHALRERDTLRGSSNQRFVYSLVPGRGRAVLGSVEDEVQDFEVLSQGESMAITGFPSIDWRTLRGLGVVLGGLSSYKGTKVLEE